VKFPGWAWAQASSAATDPTFVLDILLLSWTRVKSACCQTASHPLRGTTKSRVMAGLVKWT